MALRDGSMENIPLAVDKLDYFAGKARCDRKYMVIGLSILPIIILGVVCASFVDLKYLSVSCRTSDPAPSVKTPVDCKVAILGAGFAGAYAAYSLAPLYQPGDICLIEKLTRYGGRLWDVPEPGRTEDSAPRFGMGGLRVIAGQETMLELAANLSIEFDLPESEIELYKIRGQTFYLDGMHGMDEDDEKICKIFHGLKPEDCQRKNSSVTLPNQFLMDLVDRQSKTDYAKDHPDLKSFVASLYPNELLAYYYETQRFASNFGPTSSQSARSFLSLIEEEFRDKPGGPDPHRKYPKKGMSEYIRKMIKSASERGVRTWKDEPVRRIDSDLEEPNDPFVITTKRYIFTAERVLSSITPRDWTNSTDIQGNVTENLRKQPMMSHIKPVPVAIVAAWWNSRWWEASKYFNQKGKAVSRVVSHANCFNMMELPTFDAGRNQNATRVVYDDGVCVDSWRVLIEEAEVKGTDRLKQEIMMGLRNIFDDVEVPEPRSILGHVHENAWHYQQAYSTSRNDQILEWAKEPIPDKRIALIGEAYHLDLAAWADASLKSVIGVLMDKYGVYFRCPKPCDDTNPACSCPK